MLGSDLARTCQRRGLAAEVLDLPDFDITDKEKLPRALENYPVIVNCAAYTNVEKAESETDHAFSVNARAVGSLGEAAKKTGAWVLHISTDFVFDGKSQEPYVETDPPNPINAYGKSKLEGERLLVASGCKNCIMRVEWTYGTGGNNFVKKLIDVARRGRALKVVDDQVGSPTATTAVAEAICTLLRKKPQGLFHFAADGYVSRFDMAEFIFEKLGLDVDLTRCKTSDYPSAAVRPLSSRFDCGKVKALLDEPIEPWQGPLEKFVRGL